MANMHSDFFEGQLSGGTILLAKLVWGKLAVNTSRRRKQSFARIGKMMFSMGVPCKNKMAII
jgi:hypothetical protein